MPEPAPPDLNAIHSRVLQHADKLFEALADLEAAGGLGSLASRMSPKSVARTAGALKSTRQAIDEQLAGLKAVRAAAPKSRRPGTGEGGGGG